MSQQTYFYQSTTPLAAGSIIQPGNWGRIIEQYQTPIPNAPTFGNMNVVARELVFEAVRKAAFPGKPSRLEAAFCSPTFGDAERYRAMTDPYQFHIVYEVELCEPTRPTHIAPVAMIDFAPGTRFLSETRRRAKAYWAGDPEGLQEAVTLSPLRIVAAILS
jgi:hypothetical protein